MTAPQDIVGTGVFSPKLRQSAIVRRQISQGSTGYLGLEVRGPAGLIEPTTIKLRVFRKNDFDTYNQTDAVGELILEVPFADIEVDSPGRYYFQLDGTLTATIANLTAIWVYEVDGKTYSYTDHLTVQEYMPTYEALRPFEKAIVQQVSWMFGDLFDSTEGGPNLIENFQTHYSNERMAQLMGPAFNWLNFTGQPILNWGPGYVEGSVVTGQGYEAFLQMGLYLEVLKHFMRSYVEQPDFKNMAVTYTDRRDYLQRWKTIYDTEKPEYDKMLKLAKRKLMNLTGGALLVAGGMYGSANGLFMYGMYAAQVRSMRFLPASFAISYVNPNLTSGPWAGKGN